MKKKSFLILATMVLLLTFAVGGTIAYLVTSTNPVVNTFTPGKVTVSVTDNVEGIVKSNVVIKNTGNTSAYIRAAIVANWCDTAGNVIKACDPTKEGTFEGLAQESKGWKQIGDYYYYVNPVSAGGELKAANGNELFTRYTAGDIPTGADHLEMMILVQAIQAQPKDAVKNAWGESIANQLN